MQLAASVLVNKSPVGVFLATAVEAVLTTEFFLYVASEGKESYTFDLVNSCSLEVSAEATVLVF